MDGEFVLDVPGQRDRPMDTMGSGVAVAAIEHEDLMPLGEGEPHARGADVAGSAEEKEFHGRSTLAAQSKPFQPYPAQTDRLFRVAYQSAPGRLHVAAGRRAMDFIGNASMDDDR